MKIFPTNFDYNFFFKGIDILLDYEHAVSTPKCLWLIYHIFHIFPLYQQKELAEKLFSERFNQLFFNWSWNVRNVYMKLYLYQLYHVYGHGVELNKIEGDKHMRPPRTKSSMNFRLVKIELIAKNLSGNATSANKSILKHENSIIKDIVKLTERKNKILNELIKEFQVEHKIEVNDYLESQQSESKDVNDSEYEEENHSLSVNQVASILKEIPGKYLLYVSKSIEDFLIEHSNYLKWREENTEDDKLPEVQVQAVLDESETVDPMDGVIGGW